MGSKPIPQAYGTAPAGHRAPSIDAGASPTTPLRTIDHPATSSAPRCATATIRVPVDPQTIDHRERLWTGGVKSRPAPSRFFFKKPKAI